LGNDDKVYNLCFRDPMLFQWDRRYTVNTSTNGYVKEDINNTIWMDQWSFAKIGSVYLSDLSMRWEVNGGFGPTRNTYSISKDSGAMAVMTYTNNNEVIKQNDKYWFAASEDTCDGATSKRPPKALFRVLRTKFLSLQLVSQPDTSTGCVCGRVVLLVEATLQPVTLESSMVSTSLTSQFLRPLCTSSRRSIFRCHPASVC